MVIPREFNPQEPAKNKINNTAIKFNAPKPKMSTQNAWFELKPDAR